MKYYINKVNPRIINIQLLCKKYRMENLGISSKRFADIYNVSKSNITAFENHRANKIDYILMYYDLLSDIDQVNFMEDLKGVLNG